MHPYLPRRNLRIVIHRWGSFSCAWRPTDSELHRWPVDPTSGYVKLLLPPRQSWGNSCFGLAFVECGQTVSIRVRRSSAQQCIRWPTNSGAAYRIGEDQVSVLAAVRDSTRQMPEPAQKEKPPFSASWCQRELTRAAISAPSPLSPPRPKRNGACRARSAGIQTAAVRPHDEVRAGDVCLKFVNRAWGYAPAQSPWRSGQRPP